MSETKFEVDMGGGSVSGGSMPVTRTYIIRGGIRWVATLAPFVIAVISNVVPWFGKGLSNVDFRSRETWFGIVMMVVGLLVSFFLKTAIARHPDVKHTS